MINLPCKNKSHWIKILEIEPHLVLNSIYLESKIWGREEGIKAKVHVQSVRRPLHLATQKGILRKQPNEAFNPLAQT